MRYLGLFRLSVKEVTDNAGGGSVMDGTSACLHVHSAGKAGKVSTTTTVWCTENGTIKTSNGIYIYICQISFCTTLSRNFQQKLQEHGQITPKSRLVTGGLRLRKTVQQGPFKKKWRQMARVEVDEREREKKQRKNLVNQCLDLCVHKLCTGPDSRCCFICALF